MSGKKNLINTFFTVFSRQAKCTMTVFYVVHVFYRLKINHFHCIVRFRHTCSRTRLISRRIMEMQSSGGNNAVHAQSLRMFANERYKWLFFYKRNVKGRKSREQYFIIHIIMHCAARNSFTHSVECINYVGRTWLVNLRQCSK